MKIAYCDCFSGISGDMFLGAMVDAGLPVEQLQAELERLALPEKFNLKVSQVKKGAISASLLKIEINGETGPDLGNNNLMTMNQRAVRTEHHHDHGHDHEHSQIHTLTRIRHQRSFANIADLIEASPLSGAVKATSLAIFQNLAAAEGKIHAERPEEVHFHEVGAVDSILDIVGAAIGLEILGIERLYASPLPLGQRPGELAARPAAAAGSRDTGIDAPWRRFRLFHRRRHKEMVTPTGAAILATLATFEQPAMRITGVGTGAGQREMPWPNILRVIIGETGSSGSHNELVLIETNIDDMAAQGFGQVMGKLFSAGALDVFFTPIFMKKNRPATMLSVIAPRLHEPDLAQIILKETTTFGMRVQPIGRYEAQREMRKVSTPFGEIDVKLKILDGEVFQAVPEYDTCLRISEEKDVPFLNVYHICTGSGK